MKRIFVLYKILMILLKKKNSINWNFAKNLFIKFFLIYLMLRTRVIGM